MNEESPAFRRGSVKDEPDVPELVHVDAALTEAQLEEIKRFFSSD